MAQQSPLIPVLFREALNITSLGVAPEGIKFGTCTLESEKYICVCQGGELIIIDMVGGNTVTKRPISAEAAIMNPNSKIVALRASGQLQIFNLDSKTRIKSHTISEAIQYWRWIDPLTIALVSVSSVYHWSIEGTEGPIKRFDRDSKLEANQIIGYTVSMDRKWCLLTGISQTSPGVIMGTMQLYSEEKRVSQILNGHTGTFALINRPGRDVPAQVLCFEEKKIDSPAKLYIMEVGRDKDAPGGVFRVAPTQIPLPPDAPNDFPVAMNVSSKNDIIFMITKQGYLFLFDVHTGKALYRAKISNETVFVTTAHTEVGGIMGVTARIGSVIHVAVNEATLIPYIVNTLRDTSLAIELAGRLNLDGANELFEMQFNSLLTQGDIQGAAKLAAESPNGLLRTPSTIQRFQQIQPIPGQPPALFQYFSLLLEKGKLNAMEALELARPLLAQGRTDMLEKWFKEDKLECSAELGDLVAQSDINMALSVYLRANVPEKVVSCFVQRGEFDQVVAYSAKVGYRCDFVQMLQGMIRTNPQGAAEFAKKLVTGGPNKTAMIDPNTVVEIFMGLNRVQETTAFLLEALKNNKKEEGYLQTKLLEINLIGGSPQVADAILANEMFSHYDRNHIAKLCENAGLYQRALEHYQTPGDIKRLMTFAPTMNSDFIVNFFGNLSRETSIEVMKEMLGKNMRQNLSIVVQIATKFNDQIGTDNLIGLLESFKSYEGLFYYLGGIVNFSQEPIAHFKYIEAAAKMQQFKEVERVCRDSTVYNPEQVKKFLMDARLPDPRPLIHVCDRYDFIEEMTGYLYKNSQQKYIEVYVQKVSPQKTPMVIGKLLDLDCNEDFLRNLLNSVGHACPVEELVEQVERRNRLRLLQPWLEARVATGNTEKHTHNAIGKIYVTLNRDPKTFLSQNQFYDPQVLGKYCEKLDPSLAFLAYKRANGVCDDDLIRVTTENGLFKDQARYLVERQDLELWAKVLTPPGSEGVETPSRRALIDQVVQTALPETKVADEVSTTVKAFMTADLPSELIELLERIVLQGSDFSENRNLQNLLILTAVKADKTRVMDYINRLDNYDGPEIAKIASSEQYELYEEALVIYIKFGKKAEIGPEKTSLNVSAVEVLVDHLKALERAREFAERVAEPAVWSKLAKAQLDEDLVVESIGSYIKANDPSYYMEVIECAEREGKFTPLVSYLRMARIEIKDPIIENELIYSLAKTNALSELEEFIAAPNVANIENCGQRCFDEGMYEAAKILFKNINNNAKLALCYVNLGLYREAVEAASKGNAINTWKQVCYACVRAEEFRLAGTCGLNILKHPDHLEELIVFYERAGFPSELLKLMEQGLSLEEAHSGIFTELAILYSKYSPEKMMSHLKLYWNRMNISKVLRSCERALLWDEAVFLYKEDGQNDSAVRVMVDHCTAWKPELFIECVQKVRNQEIYYRAIGFYIEQHPMELKRLLHVLAPSLDNARVVHQLRKAEHLPLAMEYLQSVQKDNVAAVNEALNELYIEDEDHEQLRRSIDDFNNFDQIALAQRIEKHELLEFRRISAYLYKKNKRFQQSVTLSKGDKMYKDAIDTAAESESSDLAEDLLKFFVNIGDKECFCATLYTTYGLVRPDVAMELAWRNGYVDYAMPFMIQYMRNLHEKVEAIDLRTMPKEKDQVDQDAAAAAVVAASMYDAPMLGNGTMMLANAPYNPDMAYGSMGGMSGVGGMVPGMSMPGNIAPASLGGGMASSMGFNMGGTMGNGMGGTMGNGMGGSLGGNMGGGNMGF
mmetsp:Transcript_16634/g.24631  ORF Transcript_16634/g.24631 Transcript_16634/m.24631 type:complete len:1761 (+) Transcript_16634:142-5424(+)|eukprot:CAMPEP_0171452826 /NCGR_PEP_ID=MMETSP0945-20130129/777_1 /TAXON_ID=109269 /ORGANISM="Vaucheria litorea, Strain CCMP2940" /LENGTH=1760 /DNA_ID=CAMNT_0011977567 /DNA_START=140 /DNA_END=5422 /DNA_ORIENTATION=+